MLFRKFGLTIYTAQTTHYTLWWGMNASLVWITPLSASNPLLLSISTRFQGSGSLFSVFPSSINTVRNNTWVELAAVSVSHLFLRLPLWFFLILISQCASVFPTLTTSLFLSLNPLPKKLSFARISTKADNALQCFHHQQSVFFLWHCLHYNKYAYYSSYVFFSLPPIQFCSLKM